MLALITALLGLAPQLLTTVATMRMPSIPLPTLPPALGPTPQPPPDPITVVEANAINKANLESGQAVTMATYTEGGGTYTLLVVKNGGAAAAAVGL